ncbi:hypothetical protein [Candidatus Methylacidiphilum fumarolicum]|uniref:hypothetical protein n=1 Tax=Candidatus Methylacidiphilum fumarolicum TaxID=591154 RepID=UPI0024B6AE44|nr:hypothetical protein [Candidatus Methylacidiphilum fumarolicum]
MAQVDSDAWLDTRMDKRLRFGGKIHSVTICYCGRQLGFCCWLCARRHSLPVEQSIITILMQ